MRTRSKWPVLCDRTRRYLHAPKEIENLPGIMAVDMATWQWLLTTFMAVDVAVAVCGHTDIHGTWLWTYVHGHGCLWTYMDGSGRGSGVDVAVAPGRQVTNRGTRC